MSFLTSQQEVKLLMVEKIDFRDMIDVISLFRKDRISNTLYNIFGGIINKQIEDKNHKKNEIPYIIFNNNPLTINVEFNAFILGLADFFTDETRDIFIDDCKLSSENLARKSKVKSNSCLIDCLEFASKILYLSGNSTLKNFQFYKPIVYKFKNKNNDIFFQMAGIFFLKDKIYDLLNKVDIEDNLVIKNLELLETLYQDNFEQIAFANKECSEFWNKKSPKNIKKQVLLAL